MLISAAPTFALGFASSPGYGDQVLCDDAPTHVSLEARVSFVPGALHSELMFEGADARLASGSPTLALAEPALFLMLGAFGRQPTCGRQRDPLHPHVQGCFFIS
jgi:hypothetical protein